MSTGQPEKPPAVAIKETLDQIDAKVEKVLTHHEQQHAVGLLLAECRDTMTDAASVMQRQARDMLQRLDVMQQYVMQPASVPGGGWSWRGLLGSGLVGAVVVGSLWAVCPRASTPYEQVFSAIDPVLTQHYGTLPRVVQDQLTAAYLRHGVQPPSQRQKGATK